MATAHGTSTRCTAEDRRRQILATATDIFARQGFKGTTTRQIAEAAQVNEAIIFRHFPSKEELYWAVLEHKCNEGRKRWQRYEHLADGTSPEEAFASLARAYLQHRRQDASLGRLLLFSALEHHQLSRRFFETYIAKFYEDTARGIRKQIQAGKFREVDPLLAARSFFGMVWYHFLIQELFGAKYVQKFHLDKASRAIADIWLQGMLPRGKPPATGGRQLAGAAGAGRKRAKR
jgi:AcrR family transcriptional regulator